MFTERISRLWLSYVKRTKNESLDNLKHCCTNKWDLHFGLIEAKYVLIIMRTVLQSSICNCKPVWLKTSHHLLFSVQLFSESLMNVYHTVYSLNFLIHKVCSLIMEKPTIVFSRKYRFNAVHCSHFRPAKGQSAIFQTELLRFDCYVPIFVILSHALVKTSIHALTSILGTSSQSFVSSLSTNHQTVIRLQTLIQDKHSKYFIVNTGQRILRRPLTTITFSSTM